MLKIFLFIISFFVFQNSFALEAADLKTKLPGDRILGKDTAKVTVIEYASLSCGHCADFHNRILPDIKKEYIDTGKVRLIYRDFPLNQPALVASQFAHCAGKLGDNERYFTALKEMFSTQNDWAFADDYKAKLMALGKKLGLEDKALQTCLDDKDIEMKIAGSRQEASEKLGVDSTPSFFINGEKVKHIGSVEEMRKVLDNALAGKSPEEAAKEKAKELVAAKSSDMVLGKEKAKVTVVEYVNIACPHCGQFHKNLVATLQKDYIDTGKVRLVFHELPMNQTGFYAYMLAHCKGKDEFFNMISTLVDKTSEWAGTNAFISPLRSIAEKAGIDKEKFYSCIENKEVENRILKSAMDAKELGIDHSPALFVNGVKVENFNSMSAVKQAVDDALAR